MGIHTTPTSGTNDLGEETGSPASLLERMKIARSFPQPLIARIGAVSSNQSLRERIGSPTDMDDPDDRLDLSGSSSENTLIETKLPSMDPDFHREACLFLSKVGAEIGVPESSIVSTNVDKADPPRRNSCSILTTSSVEALCPSLDSHPNGVPRKSLPTLQSAITVIRNSFPSTSSAATPEPPNDLKSSKAAVPRELCQRFILPVMMMNAKFCSTFSSVNQEDLRSKFVNLLTDDYCTELVERAGEVKRQMERLNLKGKQIAAQLPVNKDTDVHLRASSMEAMEIDLDEKSDATPRESQEQSSGQRTNGKRLLDDSGVDDEKVSKKLRTGGLIRSSASSASSFSGTIVTLAHEIPTAVTTSDTIVVRRGCLAGGVELRRPLPELQKDLIPPDLNADVMRAKPEDFLPTPPPPPSSQLHHAQQTELTTYALNLPDEPSHNAFTSPPKAPKAITGNPRIKLPRSPGPFVISKMRSESMETTSIDAKLKAARTRQHQEYLASNRIGRMRGKDAPNTSENHVRGTRGSREVAPELSERSASRYTSEALRSTQPMLLPRFRSSASRYTKDSSLGPSSQPVSPLRSRNSEWIWSPNQEHPGRYRERSPTEPYRRRDRERSLSPLRRQHRGPSHTPPPRVYPSRENYHIPHQEFHQWSYSPGRAPFREDSAYQSYSRSYTHLSISPQRQPHREERPKSPTLGQIVKSPSAQTYSSNLSCSIPIPLFGAGSSQNPQAIKPSPSKLDKQILPARSDSSQQIRSPEQILNQINSLDIPGILARFSAPAASLASVNETESAPIAGKVSESELLKTLSKEESKKESKNATVLAPLALLLNSESTQEAPITEPQDTEPVAQPSVPWPIPGLWFVKPGLGRPDVLESSFSLDDVLFSRLTGSRTGDELEQTHIMLKLTCLPISMIKTIYDGLRTSPDSILDAISSLASMWPLKGKLLIMLNPGQSFAKAWLPKDLDEGTPLLDLTPHIVKGDNIIQFIQLGDLSDFMFFVFASTRKRNREEIEDYAVLDQILSNTIDGQ